VQASTAPTQDLIAEVLVERDDDQAIRQGILDQGLIIVSVKACIPCADDAVAPTIQQEHHRFDHVLVGEKR
jgi:hypothetical protein